MLSKFIERPESLLSRRNRYQLLTTLLINLICIAHGINIGWFAPIMRKMQTDDSPLSFPASVSEISWIGSAMGIGAMVGNALIGALLPNIGSKLCLLFIALPQSCLWILIYFAESVEFLYLGRFLAGISSGGMYVAHSLFLSEISDAKIRGTLGAMVMLSVNIGILLGYIAGSYMPYGVTAQIVLIVPLSYFIFTLFFVRESPVHLLRKGRLNAAEKSFRYYKNIHDINATSALSEFDGMKQKLTEDDKELSGVTIKDFFNKAALKSYVSAGVLLIANQFSGVFAMVSYMSAIFDLSGSSMDPDTCTIIIGIVQILGTYATTLFCDIWGRRILLIVSTAGVAISLTGFGLFTFFAQSYDLSEWSWIPLVLMSFCIFMGNIGLIGCFFMLLIEMFPQKIRARAASVALVICTSFVFILLNIFPLCMAHWGLPITMWSCAFITTCSFFYFVLFLKETKGKSMLED